MRSHMLRVLTMLAVAGAASSCASRVETSLLFPPAADLRIDAEPEYPVEALDPGPAGKAAEDKWHDDILAWGRKGWAQNARVCSWAVELKMSVPANYCAPRPAAP